MASEFGAHDGSSAGCGADETYHGTLYKEAAGDAGEEDEHRGKQGKCTHLYGEQHGMPTAGLEVGRFDLAEGDKQHGEDEQWLQYAYSLINHLVRALEEGEAGIDKVEHYAHHHGDG